MQKKGMIPVDKKVAPHSSDNQQPTDYSQYSTIGEKADNLHIYPSRTYQVERLSDYPYCAIGRMIMDDKNGGTGFIIGPQLILTVAHNCYNLKENKEYQEVCFTPAPLINGMFKKYKAKKLHYHEAFKQAEVSLEARNNFIFIYDFVVVELDTADNLEALYGSIGYDFRWASQKDSGKIVSNSLIIGYQLDKEHISQLAGDFVIDDIAIKHGMQTIVGHSGSPILECTEGCYILRGIHNLQLKKLRGGVLVRENVHKLLEKWLTREILRYNLNGKSSLI